MPPPRFGNEQKLNTMEKNFNSFMQSTNQLLQSNQQAIQQLTLKMSKMPAQMGERERGIFPSQPKINHKDTRANISNSVQLNAIHTFRSGKEVDNQVEIPIPIKISWFGDRPIILRLWQSRWQGAEEIIESLLMIHQLPFQISSDPRRTQHRWRRF